jgi:hypothetical protein
VQLAAEYQCSYCGELVETTVDASAGDSQSYVEDCAVCCRPNVLRIAVDPESGEVEISTEFEG